MPAHLRQQIVLAASETVVYLLAATRVFQQAAGGAA